MSQEIEILEKKIYEIVGYSFNILSTKQLVKALYDDLKLPIKDRTSSGNPSTNEEALKKLSNDFEIARLILDYRKCLKSVSSSNLDATEKKVDEQPSTVKNYVQQNKIPKPGMPQPRQVLESNPNFELLNFLNKNPDEIIEDSKITNTSVFVAQKEDDLELKQEKFDAENENINKDESLNYQSESTNIVDKSISTPSNFSLSAEQKNNFSIIKNKEKKSGNNKEVDKRKGISFDDDIKENEFSKNSVKMNLKKSNLESKEVLETKNKSNKITIAIICVLVLIIVTVLAIFLNSISSMN